MEVRNIPYSQLAIWPKNPRLGRTEAQDLVASIKAEGLLQPLIVTANGEDGAYHVIAGNRRLAAIREIYKDVPEIVEVPCNVLPAGLDDDKLLEISLAENHVRVDMHPMDEAEAFAQLARDGKDLPGIAAAFSVSERFVKQRLVLSALPLKARELFRKGEMTYEAAIALARLQDHKTIAKALKAGKEWDGNYERAAGQLANDEHRFYVKNAKFEPDSTFRITEDLFEADDQGNPAGPYFVDYDVAMEQQAIWATGHIGDLQRSGQWAFVSPRPKDDSAFNQYRRAHDGDKPETIGLLVSIEPDGRIREDKVVSLKGEKQRAKEKVKAERAKDEPVHAGELSYSLKNDLDDLRTICLIVHMAKDPKGLHEHLGSLLHFRHKDIRDSKNEDVRAIAKGTLAAVSKIETLAAEVAFFIESPSSTVWKKLKEIDLGIIEWPKSFLKRLPRKQLEAEAKALKIKMSGEITSTVLIERIWKAKPKGWVPLYAKL